MKGITYSRTLAIGFLSINFLLMLSQCQPATDEISAEAQKHLLDQFQQLANPESLDYKTAIKNAKVSIKFEPHGSIRAIVYVNDLPQYEYILDREKPQNILTKSIARANVYIIKNEKINEGLLIDDLVANRRYVLYNCYSPRIAQAKYLDRTVFIQGYSGSLNTISSIQELWYVLDKNAFEKQ
ncbi:hypothetical protein [Spirosoma sp. KNUC1025]|uniref:hypothetical protein n=1 Tax=Spirosoma sp. KNUC1025 TaxID=2894082 RepID=UPI0038688D26|nr:hypothetical protein LN737_10315 [Spirosoma sp. KNUC1025]